MQIGDDLPERDWIADDGEQGALEAVERHRYYASLDPFPSIPAALLGSPAFLKYIRTTGMIHPFRGWDKEKGAVDRNLVKPASYEMRPGGSFFHFDAERGLVETVLDETRDNYIRLPANSITFVSTKEIFRLPLYIAVRFNLRIRHVHRGILLGTGPLIDPGYDMPILIPLHNLTDADYFIPLDEGLIWVEFTKTHPSPSEPQFTNTEFGMPALPETTHDKNYRDFLFAASRGMPIRSSISGVSREAAHATARVDDFERRFRNYGIIGVISLLLAVASLLYPTLSLIFTANQNLDTSRRELSDIQHRLDALEKRAATGTEAIREDAERSAPAPGAAPETGKAVD